MVLRRLEHNQHVLDNIPVCGSAAQQSHNRLMSVPLSCSSLDPSNCSQTGYLSQRSILGLENVSFDHNPICLTNRHPQSEQSPHPRRPVLLKIHTLSKRFFFFTSQCQAGLRCMLHDLRWERLSIKNGTVNNSAPFMRPAVARSNNCRECVFKEQWAFRTMVQHSGIRLTLLQPHPKSLLSSGLYSQDNAVIRINVGKLQICWNFGIFYDAALCLFRFSLPHGQQVVFCLQPSSVLHLK